MPDARFAAERLGRQPLLKRGELALGPPPLKARAVERGDARRIIAAIFEPLQPLDEPGRDQLRAENSHDPAHSPISPRCSRIAGHR
jgi:hypothetical protein